MQGASLEQNTEVAEVLKDELNKGIKLDDVLHAAKTMKDELASKLCGVAGQSKSTSAAGKDSVDLN